jgi:hypothetical protein
MKGLHYDDVGNRKLIETLVTVLLQDGLKGEDMIGVLTKNGAFKVLNGDQLCAVAEAMEEVYKDMLLK